MAISPTNTARKYTHNKNKIKLALLPMCSRITYRDCIYSPGKIELVASIMHCLNFDLENNRRELFIITAIRNEMIVHFSLTVAYVQ